MKPLQEIVDQIIRGVIMHKSMGDEQVKQVLKEWADSIVEECAGSADTKKEYREGLDSGGYVNVVDKDSILRVKDSIK